VLAKSVDYDSVAMVEAELAVVEGELAVVKGELAVVVIVW